MLEVLALHERWQSRDLARTTHDEDEAGSACLYALAVLVSMIRAPGTPLARFIEGQVDLLSDAARAIESGERTAYGRAASGPETSTHRAPTAAAPPPSAPAPRRDRPWLRVLGIERNVDGPLPEDATLVELLVKSFHGEVESDPLDGILRSLGDDVSMVRNALQSEEVCSGDPDVQRFLYRVEQRANVAHQLWRRLVVATDWGATAPAAAPASAAPSPQPVAPAAETTATPAAYKTTYDVRWQTEDMIDRAARFLDTFAELVDRRTALDQENVAATTRPAVRAAGEKAREMLRQALAIAELDAKQATTTEEQLRFVDIIEGLRAARDGVEAAAEQNEKTRFRRRERRMKACGAMLRAQGELRKARESAAAASAAKRAAMAKGAAK